MSEKSVSYWQQANRLGLFFVALFLICFAWFYMNPAEQVLHEQLFNLTFIGFSGMSFAGVVSGTIQSYVWGYIFVGIWMTVSKVSGMK
ncbi:hypothetical protein COW94_00275 [Candidatus Peregrinibacteria bacterium CG22_combo_CG10-13_8_21_14_all_44_10]|nr:MAG: hypothetical protein AUK45_01700 [Candidatus Peregrinibacteria bacterium CG2_30_44_17]PIP66716.1 MAG: hypothetical protein COW94_00275 [Candidatus Peregrinibacteria bacterium CG22_combo_CG10-13_8_21_14_all_44_10]PIS03770.1 MAG: hypothetical protein COT83_04340 [Candidatus Peregrinibacteria bacterium CG10_big_fil_rev_8_21_14_0_10_44_7]PIX80304.1 MAG: hypothetical protein COZ35_01140 [Candidatus Peregrinibacteria bacterium CG_4_10_14_3_um_filter_44_21]PJB89390.1 MAG: hypothetical protein 